MHPGCEALFLFLCGVLACLCKVSTVVVMQHCCSRTQEYVKDAQRETVFTQNGNDQLRGAVKQVEEQNEDKVVLYHAP